MLYSVMPDLIRHPEDSKHWIPAFAGMTLYAIIYVVVYGNRKIIRPVKGTSMTEFEELSPNF